MASDAGVPDRLPPGCQVPAAAGLYRGDRLPARPLATRRPKLVATMDKGCQVPEGLVSDAVAANAVEHLPAMLQAHEEEVKIVRLQIEALAREREELEGQVEAMRHQAEKMRDAEKATDRDAWEAGERVHYRPWLCEVRGHHCGAPAKSQRTAQGSPASVASTVPASVASLDLSPLSSPEHVSSLPIDFRAISFR